MRNEKQNSEEEKDREVQRPKNIGEEAEQRTESDVPEAETCKHAEGK